MPRVLTVFVFVSACVPAASPVRESVQAKVARSEPRANVAAALRASHTSRLAPPFGRSSGVRRIRDTNEPAPPAVPAALAAADQD